MAPSKRAPYHNYVFCHWSCTTRIYSFMHLDVNYVFGLNAVFADM
jgi:hypothetical protein